MFFISCGVLIAFYIIVDTVHISFHFFRLLNKSIIRVEQPDVALDDEDEDAALEDDVAEEVEEPMEQDGEQSKVKKSISYEEYKKMSFLIIQHIREKEEQSEAGSESPGKLATFFFFFFFS